MNRLVGSRRFRWVDAFDQHDGALGQVPAAIFEILISPVAVLWIDEGGTPVMVAVIRTQGRLLAALAALTALMI